MNKKQLAERLAKQSHRSRGQAADSVDKLVHGLLKDLREAGKDEAKAAGVPPAKTLPTAKTLPAPKGDAEAGAPSSEKKDRS